MRACRLYPHAPVRSCSNSSSSCLLTFDGVGGRRLTCSHHAGLSYTTFTYKWSDATTKEKHRRQSEPALLLQSVTTRWLSSTATAATTELKAVDHQVTVTNTVDHQVTVTNTGNRAGDCVVLAFLVSENFRGTNRDEHGAPLRKLFGFHRLHDMQPGEARSVPYSEEYVTLMPKNSENGD